MVNLYAFIMEKEIQPYTLSELATMYNVCNKTMKKWLFEIELEWTGKRIFTPVQIEKIFEKIGRPPYTKD